MTAIAIAGTVPTRTIAGRQNQSEAKFAKSIGLQNLQTAFRPGLQPDGKRRERKPCDPAIISRNNRREAATAAVSPVISAAICSIMK